MKDYKKFKTVVTLKPIPKDVHYPPRDDILGWLFDNVGFCYFSGLESRGTWDHDHTYSEDNRNIIEHYYFKNSHDSTFFALKWS
jgi:hypothetical protein